MFQGGTNTDGAPCTRNGFLSSTNGEIIPEWRIKNEESIAPKDGAELHQVIDGDDKIVAIYRKGHFVEEPIQ